MPAFFVLGFCFLNTHSPSPSPRRRGEPFNSHILVLRADCVATGVRWPPSVRSTAIANGCGTSEECVCQRWRLRPPVAPHQLFSIHHTRWHWPWCTYPSVTVLV